jgi:hypothetical protein
MTKEAARRHPDPGAAPRDLLEAAEQKKIARRTTLGARRGVPAVMR